MSKTGAAERASAPLRPLTPPAATPPPETVDVAPAVSRLDASDDDFFIPDFCAARMVFAVVLVAELLAVTLSLARPAADFLTELARVSMFLQWLGLTSAALLCYARRWLRGLTVARSSLVVFGLLVANTVVISELALWFETGFDRTAVGVVLAPTASWPFLLRNSGICVIVTALLLRYFFVTHQWQTHVHAEARSRIQALQARIAERLVELRGVADLSGVLAREVRRELQADLEWRERVLHERELHAVAHDPLRAP